MMSRDKGSRNDSSQNDDDDQSREYDDEDPTSAKKALKKSVLSQQLANSFGTPQLQTFAENPLMGGLLDVPSQNTLSNYSRSHKKSPQSGTQPNMLLERSLEKRQNQSMNNKHVGIGNVDTNSAGSSSSKTGRFHKSSDNQSSARYKHVNESNDFDNIFVVKPSPNKNRFGGGPQRGIQSAQDNSSGNMRQDHGLGMLPQIYGRNGQVQLSQSQIALSSNSTTSGYMKNSSLPNLQSSQNQTPEICPPLQDSHGRQSQPRDENPRNQKPDMGYGRPYNYKEVDYPGKHGYKYKKSKQLQQQHQLDGSCLSNELSSDDSLSQPGVSHGQYPFMQDQQAMKERRGGGAGRSDDPYDLKRDGEGGNTYSNALARRGQNHASKLQNYLCRIDNKKDQQFSRTQQKPLGYLWQEDFFNGDGKYNTHGGKTKLSFMERNGAKKLDKSIAAKSGNKVEGRLGRGASNVNGRRSALYDVNKLSYSDMNQGNDEEWFQGSENGYYSSDHKSSINKYSDNRATTQKNFGRHESRQHRKDMVAEKAMAHLAQNQSMSPLTPKPTKHRRCPPLDIMKLGKHQNETEMQVCEDGQTSISACNYYGSSQKGLSRAAESENQYLVSKMKRSERKKNQQKRRRKLSMIDSYRRKKLEFDSRGSVSKMLNELDFYCQSSKYSNSEIEEEESELSLVRHTVGDEPRRGMNLAEKHSRRYEPHEHERDAYQSIPQEPVNCQSEYNPTRSVNRRRTSNYNRAMNDYDLDQNGDERQWKDLNAAESVHGSVSCNVTEHGTRHKIQKEKQRQKALKQGDVLCMETSGNNGRSYTSNSQPQNAMKSQNIIDSPDDKVNADVSIKEASVLNDKDVVSRQGGGGPASNRLVVPATVSDKGSVNSKKSRIYQNLKINVAHANTAGKNDGMINSNTIPSKLSSIPRSLQTTPSPNCSKQQTGSVNSKTSPAQPLMHQKSLISQKTQQNQPLGNSPMKPPPLTQKLNQMQNELQQRQQILQAQQQIKRQRDLLMDEAVSPFHQSQVSQSDFKQFQHYFERDNKDGYFRPDQVQYYVKEYPLTLEEEKKPLPITKWQLGKMIGHGSFGNVFEGIDQQHGRQIAVKQVPRSKIGPNQGSQQRKIRALEQEISLLNSLQHKNIVKYLGTHEDSDFLNVFLEYVPQGSLEQHYKNYQFNENLVANYTHQILLGLEYLHHNNIIHRDIKAANILLRSDGRCQLADFGSSKKIMEKNKNDPKSFCGTPYWMAPEVVKQSGHNRFADIWSLGCTVYEMIAKEPPWSDKNNVVFKILTKIAQSNKPPRYPSGISPELKDFLDCCFQNEPRMRANVYELLRHPFILREKLTTPLAHQQRLQTIAELQSNMSDASPFSQYGHGQRGFFNKRDMSKASNQKQFMQQASSISNQLQHHSSPAPMHPDVSPYSLQSSKTYGNQKLDRLQQEINNKNNQSMIEPQSLASQRRENSSASKHNSSFAYSSNGQYGQAALGHTGAQKVNASLSHGTSQQNLSSAQQNQPYEHSSSAATHGPRASRGSGNARVVFDDSQNLAVSIQHSQKAPSGEQRSSSQIHDNDSEPVADNSQLPTSVAAPMMMVRSPYLHVIQEQAMQEAHNQSQSHALHQMQQNASQLNSMRCRPETGDSENDDDQKAKKSLTVDSTGGGDGTGVEIGGRMYSFAVQSDVGHRNSNNQAMNSVHNEESKAMHQSSERIDNGMQMVTSGASYARQVISDQRLQQQHVSLSSPVVDSNLNESKASSESIDANEFIDNLSAADASRDQLKPERVRSTNSKFEQPPVIEQSKQAWSGSQAADQAQLVQVDDFGLSPILPRPIDDSQIEQYSAKLQSTSNHNEGKIDQQSMDSRGPDLPVDSSSVKEKKSKRNSFDKNAEVGHNSLIKSWTGTNNEANDLKSQISFGGKRNGEGQSMASDLQSEASVHTSSFIKEKASVNGRDCASYAPQSEADIYEPVNSLHNEQSQSSSNANQIHGSNSSMQARDSRRSNQNQKHLNRFAEKFNKSRSHLSQEQDSEAAGSGRLSQHSPDKHQTEQMTANFEQKQPGKTNSSAAAGNAVMIIPGASPNASNASNANSIQQQLNKLSLDNNLTDIEEDANENESVRKQKSVPSSQQDNVQLSQLSTRKRLSSLSINKGSVNGSDNLSTNNLVKDEERKGNLTGSAGLPHNFSSAQQNSLKNKNDSNLLSYVSEEQEQPSSCEKSITKKQQASFQSSHESPPKSPPEPPLNSQAKRKIVEDQIMKEIERAQQKQKQQLQEEQAAQQRAANAGQGSGQKAARPKKQFKIPKIFVADSNRSPMNITINSSYSANEGSSSKKEAAAKHMISPQSQHSSSMVQPQDLPTPTAEEEKKQREEPDRSEEQKQEAAVSQSEKEAAQKAVMDAILAQMNAKKGAAAVSKAEQAAEEVKKVELEVDSGSSSDSDDSSYKSPEVDSDELAILEEEDMVREEKIKSGSVSLK